MRNWIAGIMTVLGSLLVIAGAVVVALKAATPGDNGHDHEHVPVHQPAMEVGATPIRASARLRRAVHRVPAADRLIGWGIVLLVLAAITAGAIAFTLGASAASR